MAMRRFAAQAFRASALRAPAMPRYMSDIPAEAKKMQDWEPVEIMRAALKEHGDNICISFSGAEDVLLIELAHQTGLPYRVFSLDTGRLHAETYRFFQKVEDHYNIKIEYTFPNADQTMQLVQEKGMFSFYKDGHAECCGVRKVGPLKNKLSTLDAWITGVRQDQSVTRTDLPVVQKDPVFTGQTGERLVKYNPLSATTRRQVWDQIRLTGVPFNDLHLQGFVSIGCEPCTKPTLPEQHEREGRWWWENAAEKECGLHQKKTDH